MKLLLDEHIAPAVARGLQGQPSEVVTLRDWQAGIYLEAPDELILQAAHTTGWTLVTFDLRTIPTLLKAFGEQGIAHSGVILIDQRTIAQNDVGGLIRSLQRLITQLGDADWENRILHLAAPSLAGKG